MPNPQNAYVSAVFTECDDNPCQNFATCTQHILAQFCECPRDFNGTLCEVCKLLQDHNLMVVLSMMAQKHGHPIQYIYTVVHTDAKKSTTNSFYFKYTNSCFVYIILYIYTYHIAFAQAKCNLYSLYAFTIYTFASYLAVIGDNTTTTYPVVDTGAIIGGTIGGVLGGIIVILIITLAVAVAIAKNISAKKLVPFHM